MTRRRRTLKRRTVDSSLERLIVTGLITSKEYMREVHDVVDPRLFKMEYAGIIARWCKEYFQQENRVPNTHIEDIYEIEKETLPTTTHRVIETFLHGLSEEHETRSDVDVNYLIEKSKKYFNDRGIDILAEDITRLSRANKHDRARRLLELYSNDGLTSITGERLEKTFSDEVINEHGPEEDERDFLLQYDRGATPLGQIVGKLKRGWLAGILAPMKRGKTWYLDDLGIEGVIQGLSVYKFSLEMPQRQQVGRIFQMIGRLTSDGKRYVIPCFDCYHNQDGTCRKEQRTNDVRLLIGINEETGERELPEFKPRMRYKICDACRDDGTDDFLPAVWYTTIPTKSKTTQKLRKKIKQFVTHSGGSHLTKAFRFDGTISNIKADINYAIATGERKPDIVIVDYADIVQVDRSEVFGNNERASFDYVWKSLKRMAMEYNCLVLTATQGNRQSFLQDSLNETNVSEDVRKLAHCDVMWALNQRPGEYKRGIIRVSTLLHRHEKKSTDMQVAVLQCLDIGATVIDSEWVHEREQLF